MMSIISQLTPDLLRKIIIQLQLRLLGFQAIGEFQLMILQPADCLAKHTSLEIYKGQLSATAVMHDVR